MFICRTCAALLSLNIHFHYNEQAKKINRTKIAL